MPNALPPSFTSLYRLFLRLSSASVLHYQPAKLNLIARYRPAFEEAAKLTVLVESTGPGKVDPIAVNALRTWHEQSAPEFLSVMFHALTCHPSGQYALVTVEFGTVSRSPPPLDV